MVNRDKLRGTLPSQQITLAVEDVFGVSLKNEEAASILTVGQLYEHILACFPVAKQEGCLRSMAFYRLRRALLTCGVSRDKVKLNAWLQDLLPLDQRRTLWSALRSDLSLPLPALEFPNWIQFTSGIFVIVAVLLILAACVFSRLLPWSLISASVGAAILFAVIMLDRTRGSNRFADGIPSDYETVGRMVEQIVTWNYAELMQTSEKWSPEELFLAVRNVIAYICSARPEDVTADTKFVDLPDFE